MSKLSVETTAMPVLDRFKGDKALVRLSDKLMEWDGAPVTDEEIATTLGPGMVAAFRYTQSKLVGNVRKVTGEPALCHSADVAIRALALGYDIEVAQACLLHDVAEDTSSNFAHLPAAFDEIAERFSEDLAADVYVLTNRYQLIFQAAAAKVTRKVDATRRGLDAYRAAMDVLRYESSPSLVDHFGREFHAVTSFLDSEVDLTGMAQALLRDAKLNFAKLLEERIYALYVQDIVRDAVGRVRSTSGRPPVPLIVKSVDIIDNVRTSEVSNRSSLDKLARKAETIIDTVQGGFVDVVPADLALTSTVSLLHRIVQIRLVDQIKLRRRAVANNFSETRFANLVNFLGEEGNRLTVKYAIPINRIDETEKLENEVRRINQAALTHGAP